MHVRRGYARLPLAPTPLPTRNVAAASSTGFAGVLLTLFPPMYFSFSKVLIYIYIYSLDGHHCVPLQQSRLLTCHPPPSLFPPTIPLYCRRTAVYRPGPVKVRYYFRGEQLIHFALTMFRCYTCFTFLVIIATRSLVAWSASCNSNTSTFSPTSQCRGRRWPCCSVNSKR